jgi:hypothetical protein
MPYKDPDRQRAAQRASARRARAAAGVGLAPLDLGDELPTLPSRDALLRALGVQARTGNAPAIRLLLEEYRRDPVSARRDELTARRLARESRSA